MTHEFTVLLVAVPDGFPEHIADALFEQFEGDVGPVLTNGRAVLDCAVEDATLTAAVGRVLRAADALGLPVQSVEVPASEFRLAA